MTLRSLAFRSVEEYEPCFLFNKKLLEKGKSKVRVDTCDRAEPLQAYDYDLHVGKYIAA